MLFKTASTALLLFALGSADICGPVYERKNTNGMLCNAQGAVSKPVNLHKPTIITSAGFHPQAASAVCRNSCLENRDCKGYSFNTQTYSCQLYSKDPQYQGFAAGKTKNFFTNRFCYIQNFATAAGFQNPGFDQEYNTKFLQPWGRTSGSNTQSTLPTRYTGGYNSTYAALLQVGTSISSMNTTISQTFDLCPNTTYTIRPMYKFLGSGRSSSYLSLELAGATAESSSSCASASSYAFGGRVSHKWAGYAYNDGRCQNDPRTCPGAVITVTGGAYAQSLSLAMSVNWVPPPGNGSSGGGAGAGAGSGAGGGGPDVGPDPGAGAGSGAGSGGGANGGDTSGGDSNGNGNGNGAGAGSGSGAGTGSGAGAGSGAGSGTNNGGSGAGAGAGSGGGGGNGNGAGAGAGSGSGNGNGSGSGAGSGGKLRRRQFYYATASAAASAVQLTFPNPPVLDRWLVDFVVEKSVTPVAPNNGGASCQFSVESNEPDTPN